jgi:YfiR/HmsC-like
MLAVHFSLADRAVCADESPTEDQIKAAYLFNFLKFVEWPGDALADPEGKWVIGGVEDSPVGGELKRLVEGQSVDGRALLVKRFGVTDNLRRCNILFVSASEEKHLPSIPNVLQGSSVLTVGDIEHFIGDGGMIQFVTEGGRVRMDVDVGATGRARLKVSSKLLALAKAVTQKVRSTRN